MGLAFILFAGAVVILLWLYLWSLQRQRSGHAPPLEPNAFPATASDDAVIVATDHGQIVHANETIRRWLKVENPTLEIVASCAQPQDTFLELFTREGQASFQLNRRWVEAVSHRIPSPDGAAQMVLTMHELAAHANGAGAARPEILDLTRAIRLVNEIGESVNASLGVEPVLQSLLTIIRKEIPADAGEICLWDADRKALFPRGWVGDSAYVIALAEVGSAYQYGEGISGWIARYRRPVLVVNSDDPDAVQPRLKNGMYRSYAAVPLEVGDRFIGTLEFAAREQPFTQGDLALLQAIARPVTTAIYNAELYTAQTHRIEALASVQQAIDQTALEDDPVEVFAVVTERIAHLLDADICGVLVYDELRQALVAQPPYYGLPLHLVRNFAIPVPAGSAAFHIWQEQDYWISTDLADEPLADEMRLSVLVNAAGLRDVVLMPLQVGSRRIGMIHVSNKRAQSGFTAPDIQNLRVLSAQAAVVVEDIRLAEREQIHEAEMTGLQEISQAFGAISATDTFYADVNERIARLMGIAMCGILLYDEAKERLVAQKPFYGVDDTLVEHYSIVLDPQSALTQIWQDDDYWYTNHATADKIIYGAGLAELVELLGVERTLLAVMSSGGRRLGVVQVSNKLNGEDFTDNDARLLLIFAAQIAGMIENARLLRAVQERADESEGLRRVAEFAGAVMTGDDDFLPALRETCRLTASSAAFVHVLDPQTGSLVSSSRYIYGFERPEPFVYDVYSKGFEQSVAISRRPYLNNDVRSDASLLPEYARSFEQLGVRSAVIVPLIVGDQTLGELGVFNRSEPPYSDDDIRNLQATAVHIAAALDRVRLQEATGQNLRRRLQELDAISRVSNELAATLDFDRVLDVIRHESMRAADAEGSSVVLLLPPEQWHNPQQPRPERRLGDTRLSERALLTLADVERQAILQGTDAVIIEDYVQQGFPALPEDARSAIAAAFTYEDRTIGVIHLYHSQPFHFDDRAATFLMTLAAKASLSYGNHRRYLENQAQSNRLRRRVEQLNQIFELSQMLQTNVDPVTILEAFAFSVQQSIGFDIVMLMLVDEEAGVLRRVTQAGVPIDAFEASKKNTMPLDSLRTLFENDKFRVNESFLLPFNQVSQWYVNGLETLSTGQAVTRTMHPTSANDWHDGDMLIVPLYGAVGNLLGVMSLDRPFNGQRPDRTTIEILEIFAHQAAATLENTRLYMTSVRSAEQESQLNEVMEAIASTLNTAEIVEAVARGALRLLPFMRMTFVLLEPEAQSFDVIRVTVRADNSLVIARDHLDHLTGALQRTFETGQDVLYNIDEPTEDPDLLAWRAAGERTSLVVPLITGGICLGAVHLGSDLTQAFGFEEFRPLIKRIANLAAIAIQNARLFNQAVNLRLFNESVVQSIQQGIVVLDTTGHLITVNDFMRRRFGWDDAARQHLFDYRPALRPVLDEVLQTMIVTGAPQELLAQRLNDGDQVRVQNFYLYPLRSADSVRGVVLLIEDVTERVLLEADIAARANQLAALTKISSRITAALNREDVLALALDEMQRVIGYDMMSLWQREGDVLVLEGARGFDPGANGLRISLEAHDRLRQIFEARRAISISHFEGWDTLPGEIEMGSWLGAPLMRQGDLIGMITLGKREPNFYDHQAEQAVFAFANQVAVALVNASLFEDARARTERLSLLNRVSIALAQSLDVENIMEVALREIAQSLRTGVGRAYLFEREVNAARVVVEYPRGDFPPSTIIDLRSSALFQSVIRTAKPLVIEAVTAESISDPILEEIYQRGLHGIVIIPMTVSGQVSGAFELEVPHSGREFDAEKLEVSMIIANQAAIAVLNANLLEQTLVRTRELETLLEAAQATSYTLDLDEVFGSVVRLVLQALDMDDCAIMIYDNVEEELRVELDMNRQGDRNRITPSGTIYDLRDYPAKSHALREGQIIVIRSDDPNADTREIQEMEQNGESARMLVPLIVREQAIGLLQIELNTQLRSFTHREVRMAQALAAQAATAIENARLSTQTSLLVEQSLVINDISRTISSTMNTGDMIQIVREQIPSLTDADEIYVALYDPQTDEITFPLALQGGREIDFPPRMLGSDEFSFVIRFRRPLAMGGDNPSAAELRLNMGIVSDVDWTRFLGVPLMAGDQIAGVLAVRDTRQTRPFGLNDNRILTTIAAQLGATLQNAQLFERVRNFAAELNQRVEERTLELQEERDRMALLLRTEQEEAGKNSAILEGIADGVLLANAAGEVVLFNSAAEAILALPREQALGQPLQQIARSHRHTEQWVGVLEPWVMNPRRDQQEQIVDRLEVGRRVVSVHGSPVYIADQYLGMVSVFRDVTRDVEVDRMKSEFILNVSHELRTPMTSIKGYADLLLRGTGGAVTDRQRDFLETIKTNAARLADLVNDLLSISRIDSGRDRLNLEPVQVGDVVRQIVTSLQGRPQFESKGIALYTDIDPQLPVIRADQLKVMEILSHLVDNAFNYTYTGGQIEIAAHVRASVPEQVLITVKDTGIGIPSQFRDRIWNRFERFEEHALVMDAAGTGLGLSIVKSLVEMHKGEVWFESEENQGTTFYLALPIAGPEGVPVQPTVEGS